MKQAHLRELVLNINLAVTSQCAWPSPAPPHASTSSRSLARKSSVSPTDPTIALLSGIAELLFRWALSHLPLHSDPRATWQYALRYWLALLFTHLHTLTCYSVIHFMWFLTPNKRPWALRGWGPRMALFSSPHVPRPQVLEINTRLPRDELNKMSTCPTAATSYYPK